jgi:hypothetical protein
MSVLGGLLAAGRIGKKKAEVEIRMIMGKESMHKWSNSWRKTQHVRMQESVHKERGSWKD